MNNYSSSQKKIVVTFAFCYTFRKHDHKLPDRPRCDPIADDDVAASKAWKGRAVLLRFRYEKPKNFSRVQLPSAFRRLKAGQQRKCRFHCQSPCSYWISYKIKVLCRLKKATKRNMYSSDQGMFSNSSSHFGGYNSSESFRPANSPLTKRVDQVFYEVPVSKFANPWTTAPEFLKVFSDVSAREGDCVAFECMLLGNPRPRIMWLFNNKPILFNDYQTENTSGTCTFVIPSLRSEHFGTYTILAENEGGRATCSATIVPKY